MSTNSDAPAESASLPAGIRERTGMIWAQTRDGVIGNQGEMPWHVPEDLKHFQKTTADSVVIMGRKTWDSLGEKYRPLPNRINIVLSRDENKTSELTEQGATVANDLGHALQLAHDQADPQTPVWIMGGGAVYAEAVENDVATTAVITLIDTDATGDAYAPSLPAQDWGTEPATQEPWERSRSGVDYRIQTWRRH